MTSFEKIFNIFLSETKHTELAKLSEADLVYVLEHFLETSALVEFKKCRKDLSKYTKTSFIKLINGVPDIEDEVEEDIDEIDPDFGVDHQNIDKDEEIPDKDFDSGMNVYPDSSFPDKDLDSDMNVYPDNQPDGDFDSGMNVYPETPEEEEEEIKPEIPEWNEDEEFSADFNITYKIKEIGYFEEDLTHEECYIIALSMVLHHLQGNINREEYFKRTISDRDFKLADGDKIISSLLSLEKSISRKLKKYKNSYSYNNIAELRDL